jgi:hypothetical protein
MSEILKNGNYSRYNILFLCNVNRIDGIAMEGVLHGSDPPSVRSLYSADAICSIDPENDVVDKPGPVEGLSDDERALLGEALRALRRQRGQAWNAACDAAAAKGKRPPPLREYGIEDIKRLARRLGVTAPHWLEE